MKIKNKLMVSVAALVGLSGLLVATTSQAGVWFRYGWGPAPIVRCHRFYRHVQVRRHCHVNRFGYRRCWVQRRVWVN